MSLQLLLCIWNIILLRQLQGPYFMSLTLAAFIQSGHPVGAVNTLGTRQERVSRC